MDGKRNVQSRFCRFGLMPRSPLALCLGSLLLVGCHGEEKVAYKTYSAEQAPYRSSDGSSNAYDVYIQASSALDAAFAAQPKKSESTDADVLLTRTSFTNPQKLACKKASEPALKILQRAMGKACDFRYAPPKFGEALPYRSEWRMLGRALRWRIDDACEQGQFDRAIQDTILATKLGFDLTGGGPTDAMLGCVIAADARKSLVRYSPKLSVEQLRKLSQGIKKIYVGRPLIAGCIKNAELDMMVCVQAVQDAFQKEDYSAIEKALGQDAKDPVQYLKDLRSKKATERIAYFDGLAADGKGEVQRLLKLSELSFADRKPMWEEKKKSNDPWKRFSKHFFGVGKPLLTMYDEFRARTQLFILDTEIIRTVKTQGSAPLDLHGFTKELTVDPFTNHVFGYHADGTDYRVYSVGEDLTDNGGDTNDTFSKPDIQVERSQQ